VQFALVHSPFVGPSTWRWVAGALAAAGHDATVPDLRDAAITGVPRAVITATAASIPSEWTTPVVVGHSGAGSILPSVAEQLDARPPRLIFVDAGLPPWEGSATPGADFVGRVRALAIDGVLPKWSTWWGDGAMQLLVSTADRRAELEAEMPEIPLAFFESPLDVPNGWCETPGSYLLLSEPYRADAERARALGWPTVERLGGHLDIVNDPDHVAHTILELAT
jgi:hypothetical protein